jgi:hypothetical protein
LTVVKNKVNRPNACFITLCQSTDLTTKVICPQ